MMPGEMHSYGYYHVTRLSLSMNRSAVRMALALVTALSALFKPVWGTEPC